MKYCQNCGAEINDNAVICLKCGCSINQSTKADEIDDSISVGLVILAILFPIFGIIYWPVKSKERPRCAKVCGISAIIAWVLAMMINVSVGL